MSAGWVAGSVRARALARRRLGPAGARQVAGCGSLHEALGVLAGSAYASACHQGQGLAAVQHAVAATVLWNLRVLAGWLPSGGLAVMRPLAGWFEIANIDELIEELEGRPAGQRFELGALATAWPRLRGSASLGELRESLAASSAWQDPGGDSGLEIRVGVRARWAQRVAALGRPAPAWAAGAVALLVAGERFAAGRPLNPAVQDVARSLVGTAADAGTYAELRDRLPAQLAWALEPAQSVNDLWRAEAAWYARVELDGFGLLGSGAFDWHPVLGAAAVLATDARRTGAALELAARGGTPLEAYDAVA